MNKKTKLVLDLLKPKAKSLGFTKEELEGVAENIANNLGLDDDATEEALNAAVTKAVDAALPFLELSQKNANRIIQKNKEEREAAEAEAKRKAEEEAKQRAEQEAREKAEKEAKAKAEAERKAREEEIRKQAEQEGLQRFLDSEWAKSMKLENEKLAEALKMQQEAAKKAQDEFAAFRDEFNAMKAEKVKVEREKRLETLLEGSGRFGERVKKNYAKMTFGNDQEFEDFCNEVKEDITAFNQERADKGLERLGVPAAGEKEEQGEVKPMTEAEIDALAAIM